MWEGGRVKALSQVSGSGDRADDGDTGEAAGVGPARHRPEGCSGLLTVPGAGTCSGEVALATCQAPGPPPQAVPAWERRGWLTLGQLLLRRLGALLPLGFHELRADGPLVLAVMLPDAQGRGSVSAIPGGGGVGGACIPSPSPGASGWGARRRGLGSHRMRWAGFHGNGKDAGEEETGGSRGGGSALMSTCRFLGVPRGAAQSLEVGPSGLRPPVGSVVHGGQPLHLHTGEHAALGVPGAPGCRDGAAPGVPLSPHRGSGPRARTSTMSMRLQKQTASSMVRWPSRCSTR